jgi:hypothetical protein
MVASRERVCTTRPQGALPTPAPGQDEEAPASGSPASGRSRRRPIPPDKFRVSKSDGFIWEIWKPFCNNLNMGQFNHKDPKGQGSKIVLKNLLLEIVLVFNGVRTLNPKRVRFVLCRKILALRRLARSPPVGCGVIGTPAQNRGWSTSVGKGSRKTRTQRRCDENHRIHQLARSCPSARP